jgi:hypothetical protein
VVAALEDLLGGRIDRFAAWLNTKCPADASLFDRAAVAAELESLAEFPSIRKAGLASIG